MDTINGIPPVWNTGGDNALLGGLFPQGSNEVGQAQNSAIPGSSSRNIWQQIRAGTSYEVATDCDKPFSADFYYGGIHYEDLIAFLKMAMTDDDALFNYCDYQKESDLQELLGQQNIFPSFNPEGQNWSPIPKFPPNTGFKYKNAKGETVTASLSGRLNKRVCYLEEYGCRITLDAANKVFSGTVRLYYDGTRQFRKDAKDTAENGDFRIDDMYVAAELTTSNINDFLYLIKGIGGESNFRYYKGVVARKYAEKIKNSKDSTQLKVFYESLPEAIMDSFSTYLPYEIMYSHIILLTEYDDDGWLSGWRDGSSSLINLLRSMNDSKLLYYDLCNDPKLVNRIYGNLDGASVIDGISMSNKTAFANILRALCAYNEFDGAEKFAAEFHYGTGYDFNANVVFRDDKEKKEHSIFLEQLKETSKYIPEQVITSPNMKYRAKTGGYSITDTVTAHSGHYGPLERVYLIDETDGGKKTAVPALYIKALSDEEEWQDIHRNIRFGANVLMLILGIASLGATSPLLLAAAYADIALAVGDMGVMAFEEELKKTKEGQDFLAAWDQVMIAGGIVTAGPLLVTKIFTSGTKVLRLAKEGQLINAMQDCLMQVVQKSKNMGIFVKGKAEVVFDLAKEFGAGNNLTIKLKALQDLGVAVVKGQLKFAKYEGKGYVLLYKDEIIAKGTVRDLINEVAVITKRAAGSSVEDVLEDSIWVKKIDQALDELKIGNIPANKLSAIQSRKRLQEIINRLSKNKKLVFNPKKEALEKLGIDLPKSKNGLSVDFNNSRYIYPAKHGEKSIIKIKLTGHDNFDKRLANKLGGFPRTPKGYTWHHLDDYSPLNGTCTMQLVETNIHQACLPHYGAVKLFEDFLNFKYLTRQ